MQSSRFAEVAPTPSRRGMLLALNYTGKHIYAGTVPEAVKARRRAANKVARRARRAARR
jgi:hypothetical protein